MRKIQNWIENKLDYKGLTQDAIQDEDTQMVNKNYMDKISLVSVTQRQQQVHCYKAHSESHTAKLGSVGLRTNTQNSVIVTQSC